MREVQQASDMIVSSAEEFWQTVGSFLPQLIAAILLIILAALIAKAGETATRKVLNFVGVDKLKSKKNVKNALKKARIDVDFVNITARIVFWFIIIVFAITIADVLGLNAMRDVIRELLSYLPSVLAGVIVLTVTIAGARLVRDAILAGLTTMSVDYARAVATLAQWVIIVFGSIMALDQLGFDTTIVAANVTIIVAGVTLALALAFGLGGREIAQDFLKDAQGKLKSGKKSRK